MFGSANCFESYCVHMKSPRTYSPTTRQTDKHPNRQTDIFYCLFCLLRHTKHEHSSKGENFFFFYSLMQLQSFLFLHTPYVMRKYKSKNKHIIMRYSYARPCCKSLHSELHGNPYGFLSQFTIPRKGND